MLSSLEPSPDGLEPSSFGLSLTGSFTVSDGLPSDLSPETSSGLSLPSSVVGGGVWLTSGFGLSPCCGGAWLSTGFGSFLSIPTSLSGTFPGLLVVSPPGACPTSSPPSSSS